MRKLCLSVAMALALSCAAPPPSSPAVMARANEILLNTGIPPKEATPEERAFATEEATRQIQDERSGVLGDVLGLIPGGLGGALAGLYGVYLAARPRSRRQLGRVVGSAVTGDLRGAVVHLDRALGGGHSGEGPPAPTGQTGGA